MIIRVEIGEAHHTASGTILYPVYKYTSYNRSGPVWITDENRLELTADLDKIFGRAKYMNSKLKNDSS